MSTTSPSVDLRAVRMLEPLLDEGETLIWAEQPDAKRMLLSSFRAFIFNPLTLASITAIAAMTVWIIFREPPTDQASTPWLAIVGAMLIGTFVIDLLAFPLFIAPFFTPIAYGATRGYFLICRGPLGRRLLRTPVSVVIGARLAPWGGHRAVVFDVHKGEGAAFAFLHLGNPDEVIARLNGLLPPSPQILP